MTDDMVCMQQEMVVCFKVGEDCYVRCQHVKAGLFEALS